jgi:hypothetical protein
LFAELSLSTIRTPIPHLTGGEKQRRWRERHKQELVNARADAALAEGAMSVRKLWMQAVAEQDPEKTRLSVNALINEIYEFDIGFPKRVQSLLQTRTPTEDGIDAIFQVSQKLIDLSNEVMAKRLPFIAGREVADDVS